MFKKAKKRIVISILAILCAVLVGTLGLIYLTSYLSVTAQNYKVLEQHAEILSAQGKPELDGGSGGEMQPGQGPFEQENNNNGESQPDQRQKDRNRMDRNLEIGTFYTVKLLEDGTAIVVENGADGVYSDEDLTQLAELVKTGTKGKTKELLYVVTHTDGEAVVCFMDNTVFTDSFSRLFLFTLLFGVIAIIIIAFISVHIANRIVSPMEETYKKQKQFTADAGHELKTPIAAVAANIELLRREIGENKWLENISYENERMRELVTELLELARNENQTMEKQITDLSRIVNGAILPLEAAAFEKNILIVTDIEGGILANIEEKSISQLVTILVDNAISHTTTEEGENNSISVKLSSEKGTAVLRVSNPGEEIPESEREKLFERFYRTDSSHEFTGHYGLGLAIAKAIADANGAKISVSCPNDLVMFTVTFPLK